MICKTYNLLLTIAEQWNSGIRSILESRELDQKSRRLGRESSKRTQDGANRGVKRTEGWDLVDQKISQEFNERQTGETRGGEERWVSASHFCFLNL